jgi:hypothetical protein
MIHSQSAIRRMCPIHLVSRNEKRYRSPGPGVFLMPDCPLTVLAQKNSAFCILNSAFSKVLPWLTVTPPRGGQGVCMLRQM